MKTRFGYFDFRLNFLNLSRNGAILPKNLCRIHIWVSKIEIQIGQMNSGFFRNVHRCHCNQKLNNYQINYFLNTNFIKIAKVNADDNKNILIK